jgi:2-isopropylmalate synthase
MDNNQVLIFDTTLRDGEQSPGCSMTTQEKLSMAHALEDLGVDILEAGFAMASEGDFAAIATITQAIRGPRITSLARARSEDIIMAARSLEHADRARIHVFLASSDLHLEYKLKMSREQALDQAAESVRQARSLCDDVEFSPEDATRSDRDFLVEMVRVAIEAGATTINMPDTVGYATPAEYGQMFREVRQRIPAVDAEGIVLSSHTHDDLGLAVANLTSRRRGWSAPGRVRHQRHRRTRRQRRSRRSRRSTLRPRRLLRRDHRPSSGQALPHQPDPRPAHHLGASPNKAIVGSNAFAHESGIHQHGMLANPLCYEIMTPALVGASGTQLVLGKHSGRAALRNRLEQLGYTLSREELQQTYYRFVALADRKKNIYDQDLIGLLSQQIRDRRPMSYAEVD